MRILIIAPSVFGLGETVIARNIAASFHRRGDEICILTSATSAFLFRGDERFLVYELVPLEACFPLNILTLEGVLGSFRPNAVVVSDYFTGSMLDQKYGIDLSRNTKIPIFYIDLYDWPMSDHIIDSFDGKELHVRNLRSNSPLVLQPSPILTPTAFPQNGVTRYNGLFGLQRLSRKQKTFLRQSMGLQHGDRLIMLTTAHWQHLVLDRHPWTLGSLQRLLQYVYTALPNANLVHIGPSSLGHLITFDLKYMWFPQMHADRFDALLSASDVFITQNIISTTLTKAIELGVPSIHFYCPQNINKNRIMHDDCMENAYPYHVWPLGWHRFISRILEGNPMMNVIKVINICNSADCSDALRSVVDDQNTIQNLAMEREQYLATIDKLPTIADVVASVV